MLPGDVNHEEAGKKLAAMVDCGITVCINLMEENELNWFRQLFVPYEGQLIRIGAERGVAVTCVRMPIADYGIASRFMMVDILDRVDAAVDGNGGVYLHCPGGKGRTGMVVGCYLARHGIAAGGKALERIRILLKGTPSPAIPRLKASLSETWSVPGSLGSESTLSRFPSDCSTLSARRKARPGREKVSFRLYSIGQACP